MRDYWALRWVHPACGPTNLVISVWLFGLLDVAACTKRHAVTNESNMISTRHKAMENFFPLFTAACMLPACCLMLPAAAWLALCFSASCFHACSFLLFSVSHCSFLPFAAPRETNAPTNKQTIKQTDKQTNQQTIKLTNKQIQADTPFARYTHAPPQLYLIC